jgi:glutamine synthetase
MSTEGTRNPGGADYIANHIMPALDRTHKEVMDLYGEDNRMRLTGRHETGAFDVFSWGVGTRNTSCRVPVDTQIKGRGRFEDRRPSSNMDPYLCTAALTDICLFGGKRLSKLQNHLFKSIHRIFK